MHAVHFWGQGSSYLSDQRPVTEREGKGEGTQSISPWTKYAGRVSNKKAESYYCSTISYLVCVIVQ